jgi:hypothetical protein
MVEVMEQEHVALTPPWRAGEVPGWAWTEFTVASATMEWGVEEAVAELARVFLG